MKVRYIVALMLGCLFTVSPIWAQDVTEETWDGSNTPHVVNDLEFKDGKTHLIYLKGKIEISGTITVDGENTTVRFLNESDQEVTISNTYESSKGSLIRAARKPMFKVINQAKLAFNYVNGDASESYSTIVIDGGADFSEMTINETEGEEGMVAGNGAMFHSAIIQSVGALELYNVKVQNFHGRNDENNPTKNSYSRVGVISLVPTYFYEEETVTSGGTGTDTGDGTDTGTDEEEIVITAKDKPYGYTKLVNCIFEKCKARAGTVLNVGDYRYLEIQSNPNDAARLITMENCTIRNCVTYGDKDGWGGMIRFKGGSVHSLHLKNCLFENNFSYGDGAGLWWNAAAHKQTQCTIEGCTFQNNIAMRECGAIRLETNFKFIGSKTTVSNNQCLGWDKFTVNDEAENESDKYLNYGTYVKDSPKANGGGISIYGYESDTYKVGGGDFEYNLSQYLEVKDNYAKGFGGGIAFDFTKDTKMVNNTHMIALFNGATITDNVSGKKGGGVYFRNETEALRGYRFSIYLNSGTIERNRAPEGGGMYVRNLNIAHDKNNKGEIEIKSNVATNGSGGGIYLENGIIDLYNAKIQSNQSLLTVKTSFAGGGGLYVENGKFTIGSGEISGNTSESFGGGVLVKSETVGEANQQEVTLSGGTIKNNEAHYGGGLAALGNLSLALSQVNIENNTALNGNGGGVFVRGGITAGLADYATLTYNAGIVRQNKATCTGTNPTTAYGNNQSDKVTYASVSGMGGGICLGMNTTLQFVNLQSFGIYDNEADSGADDLFATENNTVVNLPDVKSMTLQGYDEDESHTLFWFEDYITEDPNYCYGTAINKNWTHKNSDNQRYRDVRNGIVDGDVYYYTFEGNAASATFTGTYLCLTLGWNVGPITLIKEGMKDGENAIFRILKKQGEDANGNGVYKEYMTVILTHNDIVDPENENQRVKTITLNEDGIWRIEETPWSWAYTSTPEAGYERTLNASSTVAERTFTFTNTPKTGNDVPVHGESVKINQMNTVQQQ